jgi:hypothetical protein
MTSIILDYRTMKPWYQSWTVWVAVIQGIGGIIAAVLVADPTIKTAGALAAIKAAIDLLLRIKTTQAIV